MTLTIPKPPKGGYNVLWESHRPDETSRFPCWLLAAHVDAGRWTGEPHRSHVYLEQRTGSHQVVRWTRLTKSEEKKETVHG